VELVIRYNRTQVFSVQDTMVAIRTVTEIYFVLKAAWESMSPEFKQDLQNMLGKIWEEAPSVEN
jgi:hypothetical protein